MVFQIVTNYKRVLTVHTEVGNGLAKVIVDEDERNENGMAESKIGADAAKGKGTPTGE